MSERWFAAGCLLIVGALLVLGWYALFEVYPRFVLAAIDVYMNG